MPQNDSRNPVPPIEQIKNHLISTLHSQGRDFIEALKQSASVIREDARRIPERLLIELRSYSGVEIVSFTVSLILLVIVFMVAAKNAVRMY